MRLEWKRQVPHIQNALMLLLRAAAQLQLSGGMVLSHLLKCSVYFSACLNRKRK